MASQDNRSFFDLMQEVSHLPEYTHYNAIGDVVAVWRKKSPLVDEAIKGETTFEKAVKPLVEENLRITFLNRKRACNTPEFEAMAKETAERFAGILPLRGLTERVDFGKYLKEETLFSFVVAFSPVLILRLVIALFGLEILWSPWELMVFAMAFGSFVLLVRLFAFHTLHVEKNELAKNTLERAKFLDRMIEGQRVRPN